MGWLEHRVALVTGGGSGIGRAIVARYLVEGAKVGVLEYDPKKVKALQEEFGDNIIAVTGDVSKLEDNEKAVAATIDAFGKLDIFVGNAGVFDYFQTLMDLSRETIDSAFDELFAVNVKGCLLGAKASVPELLKTEGCIIFTLSNAAFYAAGGGPLYTSSKHALLGLVRELAYELAPKVRVNGVAPGGTITELHGLKSMGMENITLDSVDGLSDMMRALIPLQMVCDPADHAGSYVLLASKENSRAITGVVINSDGGIGIRGLTQAAGGVHL